MSTSRGGFFFLGNQLALDLLNTRPRQGGEAVELLPGFGSLLRWFRDAGLLSSAAAARLDRRWARTVRARRALAAILDLREKLRAQVLAWERGAAPSPSFVAGLNRLLARHPMRVRLHTSGGAVSRDLWFETREPGDLLAPLAHAAAILFADTARDRVRKCANCVLHFHDTSKKGTRRWCSMQLCGNRLKVAAYAARRR